MWKKTIKNSTIVFTGVIISRFFIFLSNTIIIRQLNVSDYALFSLLTSILTWVLVFSHMDLYAAVSRFVSERNANNDEASIRAYYRNAVLMGAALSAVGVVIGVALSWSQNIPTLSRLIFMASLMPLALMTVNDGLLKGFHRFELSAAVDSSNGFSRFLVLLPAVCMLDSLSLQKILFLTAVATLVPFLLSWRFARKTLDGLSCNSHSLMDRDIMSDLFRYSRWVCLTDLFSAGLFLFANFVIAAESLEDLAQFNIIILLYSVFQMFFGAITTVLIPQISHAAAQKEAIQILGRREIVFLFLISSLLMAAIYFFPLKEEMLMLLFGKVHYADALNYIVLLLFTFPFRIASTTSRGIVQGLNRPRSIASTSAWTFGLSALIFLVLYKIYGLWGSIAALNASHVIEYVLAGKAAGKALGNYKHGVAGCRGIS